MAKCADGEAVYDMRAGIHPDTHTQRCTTSIQATLHLTVVGKFIYNIIFLSLFMDIGDEDDPPLNGCDSKGRK